MLNEPSGRTQLCCNDNDNENEFTIDNSQFTISRPDGSLNPKLTMKINWKEIIKLLITVLTAIAGTLGVMSCTM